MKKITPKTARFLAISTLAKLKKTKRPVTDIFDRLVGKQQVIASERRLAFNLIYGVLRHYQSLDHILAGFCRKPLKKLHPMVHQGLLVGLFQILFLDRIPPSAAVNETVGALKCLKTNPKITGFVNGVLRAIIRKQDQLVHPTELESREKPILNHPGWLTDRWQKQFGEEEMVRICKSNNNPATLILRVNSSVTSKEDFRHRLMTHGITVNNGRFAPDALILPDFNGSVTDIPGFEAGAFQVQDEGAQLIPYLFTPFSENGHYLDGCAGLGSKTCHLLQLGRNNHITVTAVEPQKKRFQQLLENLKRLKMDDQVTIQHQSLQDYCRRSAETFDGVLLDVPCSGTGVIGRHPDIRWNREEKELSVYRKTQLQLLDYGARMVREGGILVYATCSLATEENENVVADFLDANNHFSREDLSSCLPEPCRHFVKDQYLQTLPDSSIDGFFAVRLVRKK